MKDAKQKQSAFSMRCVDVGCLRVNGDSLRRADIMLLLQRRRINLAALKHFKIELMFDPVRKNISVLVWRSSNICYLCSVVKKRKGIQRTTPFLPRPYRWIFHYKRGVYGGLSYHSLIERVNESKLVYFIKENVLVYKTNTFQTFCTALWRNLMEKTFVLQFFPKQ